MYSFVSITYFNESNNFSLGLDWDTKMVTTDLLESEDGVAKGKMDYRSINVHTIKKNNYVYLVVFASYRITSETIHYDQSREKNHIKFRLKVCTLHMINYNSKCVHDCSVSKMLNHCGNGQ